MAARRYVGAVRAIPVRCVVALLPVRQLPVGWWARALHLRSVPALPPQSVPVLLPLVRMPPVQMRLLLAVLLIRVRAAPAAALRIIVAMWRVFAAAVLRLHVLL